MSISISYNDTIIFSKGFGYADLEKKSLVIPSKTLFDIGSISKIFTAISLAKLYENKEIDLDKSVNFYLDSLENNFQEITTRNLLAHIFGLSRDLKEDKYLPETIITKSNFYSHFLNRKAEYNSLEKFMYSNLGYKILGLAIENISKQDLVEFQKNEIFKPLHLDNTYANEVSFSNKYLSSMYSNKKGDYQKVKYVSCVFRHAEGCHLSTSEDLIKLGNAFLFPNRLLAKETIIELVKSQSLKDGKKTNYGKGFEVHKDNFDNFFYGHGGNAISARSELKIYPNSKLVITMVANKSKYKDDDLLEKIANNYINLISKLN